MGGQDWIGLMIFKNFADQHRIGFNFIGSGLDLHWKFSQSAHLWHWLMFLQGWTSDQLNKPEYPQLLMSSADVFAHVIIPKRNTNGSAMWLITE